MLLLIEILVSKCKSEVHRAYVSAKVSHIHCKVPRTISNAQGAVPYTISAEPYMHNLFGAGSRPPTRLDSPAQTYRRDSSARFTHLSRHGILFGTTCTSSPPLSWSSSQFCAAFESSGSRILMRLFLMVYPAGAGHFVWPTQNSNLYP